MNLLFHKNFGIRSICKGMKDFFKCLRFVDRLDFLKPFGHPFRLIVYLDDFDFLLTEFFHNPSAEFGQAFRFLLLRIILRNENEKQVSDVLPRVCFFVKMFVQMQLLRFFVMLHIVRILEVINVKHVRNFNAPFKHGCRRKKVNETDEVIVLNFHFVFPRRKKFFRLRNQVFQFDCFVDVTFVNYRERHEIFFDCCIDTLFNAGVQRRSDNQGLSGSVDAIVSISSR